MFLFLVMFFHKHTQHIFLKVWETHLSATIDFTNLCSSELHWGLQPSPSSIQVFVMAKLQQRTEGKRCVFHTRITLLPTRESREERNTNAKAKENEKRLQERREKKRERQEKKRGKSQLLPSPSPLLPPPSIAPSLPLPHDLLLMDLVGLHKFSVQHMLVSWTDLSLENILRAATSHQAKKKSFLTWSMATVPRISAKRWEICLPPPMKEMEQREWLGVNLPKKSHLVCHLGEGAGLNSVCQKKRMVDVVFGFVCQSRLQKVLERLSAVI